MRHKLIALEGIDGVGKTAISRCLVQELKKRGMPAVRFEDTERRTKGFNSLKPFIKANAPLESRFFFYISSAIYKSELIAGLLASQWVVCDRYIYSTLAHHQARDPLIASLINMKKLRIRWPDYCFLIVVKDAIRLGRVRKRKRVTKADLIPKRPLSMPGRVEQYLKSYKPIVIDNSSPNVSRAVNEILKKIGCA